MSEGSTTSLDLLAGPIFAKGYRQVTAAALCQIEPLLTRLIYTGLHNAVIQAPKMEASVQKYLEEYNGRAKCSFSASEIRSMAFKVSTHIQACFATLRYFKRESEGDAESPLRKHVRTSRIHKQMVGTHWQVITPLLEKIDLVESNGPLQALTDADRASDGPRQALTDVDRASDGPLQALANADQGADAQSDADQGSKDELWPCIFNDYLKMKSKQKKPEQVIDHVVVKAEQPIKQEPDQVHNQAIDKDGFPIFDEIFEKEGFPVIDSSAFTAPIKEKLVASPLVSPPKTTKTAAPNLELVPLPSRSREQKEKALETRKQLKIAAKEKTNKEKSEHAKIRSEKQKSWISLQL